MRAARLPTLLLVLLAPLTTTLPAAAADAWLMTYGTADRIEERFGHNALWIRDPERGIDTVYNFGFFDFDTPGFVFDYLQGDLVYYAVARDPVEELAYYQWRDRSVRAQLLDLDDATIRRLSDWLEQRVQPDTRDFAYDYYFNNCSTRIRDALDFALDGALREATGSRPAVLDLRQHTRRLVRPDPALYLGIQAALGRRVDRPRTAWEEMFLPEVVAREIGDLRVDDGQGGTRPLVIDDRMLHESARPDPAPTPSFPWGATLGLLCCALGLLALPLAVFRRRAVRLAGWRAWLAFNALGGSLLLYLWLATSHAVTAANENLLLLNPLLGLLWRARGGRTERVAAGLIAAGLLLAVLLKLVPGNQWNLDLLLALVPAQLLALWIWRRAGSAPGRTGAS
ncbi:lipoprotein N-acyltransferase Lnb domain-containing protein [Halomonas denitrificans]|nr:DUF4105 domain-containing protein [Halomonas denitrificans]